MNKHGKVLKGIIGMTSVATPAAAEAITQANKCGEISVVGLALPNSMKPYVNKWDVLNQLSCGTRQIWVMQPHTFFKAIDGTLKPGDTSVKAGKLGELKIVNGSEVLLKVSTTFTKENINQFDF